MCATMRAVSLSAALIAAAAACAMPPVHDFFDIGRPGSLRMHWRLRPHSTHEARWGVVWNFTDSANYDMAEIVLHDGRYLDALGREAAALLVSSVRAGVATHEPALEFAPKQSMRSGGGSLRLQLHAGTQQPVLEAGSGEPQLSIPVQLVPGTRMGVYTLCDADTMACTFECDTLPAPFFAPFADVAALRAYLAASRDPNEAEWVYYDRDTDPVRVSTGGDYRLATVSDGQGGYGIYYLGGAETHPGKWRPLQLKGRLAPTGFIDQFDLYWLDAAGESMGRDCSATLAAGNLLTLNFPLYKAVIRYRRTVK